MKSYSSFERNLKEAFKANPRKRQTETVTDQPTKVSIFHQYIPLTQFHFAQFVLTGGH